MTWFKVDDKFHSHSKTRKVLAEAPAALALWVVAGSWSSDNLTDGFVPDHQLSWLIPDGAEGMARQLVSVRLWKRVRGGHQFHEWTSDADGTKRNPTRDEVEAERRKKAEAGRLGGLARGRKGPTHAVGESQRGANEGSTRGQRGDFKQASYEGRAPDEGTTDGTAIATSSSGNTSSKSQACAKAPASGLLDPPTRPDPYIGGALRDPLTTARTQPPSPLCSEHQEAPADGPCGRCRDARLARERWDLADADRRRNADKCRSHRGQPADNCALCRSEALAHQEVN